MGGELNRASVGDMLRGMGALQNRGEVRGDIKKTTKYSKVD